MTAPYSGPADLAVAERNRMDTGRMHAAKVRERADLERKLKRMFPRLDVTTRLVDYDNALAVSWQKTPTRRYAVRTMGIIGVSDQHHYVGHRILKTAYPALRHQP